MAHGVGSGGDSSGGGPGTGAKGGDTRKLLFGFGRPLPGGFGGRLAVGTETTKKSLLLGIPTASQRLSSGQEPLGRRAFGLAETGDNRFTTLLTKKSNASKTLLGL